MKHTAAPKAGLLLDIMAANERYGLNIPWIVAFSSTSAAFGFPGQTPYCAANAVLDSLAQFPRKNGDPEVVAINWGPWAEAGMAQKGTRAYEESVKEGDTPLETETALDCLEMVIANIASLPTRQFLVADAQWEKTSWRDSAYLRELVKPRAAKAAASGVREFLASHVERDWGDVAELNSLDLGLDSLDLVQLRGNFIKQFYAAPLSLFNTPQSFSSLASALEALKP
jgi:acyl carrier protein